MGNYTYLVKLLTAFSRETPYSSQSTEFPAEEKNKQNFLVILGALQSRKLQVFMIHVITTP